MPRLTNPTGRNTKARIVEIAGNEYFFSYETCIAFRGHARDGNFQRVRVANTWGPTTGRHFKELGCADFEIVSQERFDALVGK